MAENNGDDGADGAGEQKPQLTAEDLALADALDNQNDGNDGQEGADDNARQNAGGNDGDNRSQQNDQQRQRSQQEGADNNSGDDNQQQQQPASFRNIVGTIEDESLRNVAGRFNSVNDMAKAIVDLRSDNSKRIRMPDENASDEDRAKWLRTIGVPEEATGEKGYKISFEDGVEPTEQDQAIIDRILPIAHKYGGSQDAVAGIVAEAIKISHEAEAEHIQTLKDYQEEQTAALKKEWGKDYDSNINLAKRFAQTYADGSFQDILNVEMKDGGVLGDHPVMQKFLANLGRRTSEGEVLIGNTKEERQTAKQELDELNRKVPPGSTGYTDRAHQQKLSELYALVYGDEPIVGTQGRAA